MTDPFASEAIRAAVQPHLPAPISSLQPVAGSVANRDFIVSTDRGGFVVKVGDRSELAAEAWACERVRRAGIASPEVVAVDLDGGVLPAAWLVLRRFPGRALPEQDAEGDAGGTVLVEVGRQLRLLHSLTLSGYGALAAAPAATAAPAGPAATSPAEPAGPHREWRQFTQECLQAVDELVGAGVVSASLAERVTASSTRHAASLTFGQRGSLLHGDLKLQHLFADRGRYVGIIDWGDVSVGDPRWDLARLSMSGPRVLTRVLDGYGTNLDADTEVSLAGYRVLWNVRSLAYELRAGGDWFAAYRGRIESDLDCGLLD